MQRELRAIAGTVKEVEAALRVVQWAAEQGIDRDMLLGHLRALKATFTP